MRKLFQNNVSNRTDITVKIFTIFYYIYYLGSWEREDSFEKVLLRNFC